MWKTYSGAVQGSVRYSIQEKIGSEQWAVVYTGAALSTTISALQPTTAYNYRIKVFDDSNQSDWSPPVAVSTTST